MAHEDELADFYAEIASVERAVQAKVRAHYLTILTTRKKKRNYFEILCRSPKIIQSLERG